MLGNASGISICHATLLIHLQQDQLCPLEPSAYLFDMLNLPGDVKAAFDGGKFAVKQTSGSYNGVWSDIGTEKTIVRDAKGDSGIVGLTRKKAALPAGTQHISSIC